MSPPSGSTYEASLGRGGAALAQGLLARLLDCHPALLATLATATFPLLQQFPGHCSKANLTIAKTIRLRGSHLRHWLEGSDVKVPRDPFLCLLAPLTAAQVVHLVRDPRAILASMALQVPQGPSPLQGATWGASTSTLCRDMVEDLGMADWLPRTR